MSEPKRPGPAPGATIGASIAVAPPRADLGGAPEGGLLDLPVVPRERYAIDGEQGRGGLGRVMRAEDRHLGREVALKELLRKSEPALAARFVREALVTARLQHPGIVPVYEAGRWPDGEPFYAMKLVAGQSLRDAIAARPGLDERLALVPRVLAAAEAVAFAHSRGVIHRDLKPSNLVLGPFGETVVIDWGLAKDLDAADVADALPEDAYALAHFDMTRVGAVVGTPGYMPPEQAGGQTVDARADVFSLGAMLYHVLAGAPPYAGDAQAQLAAVRAGAPPPLAERQQGVPRDLGAIVDKAMARDPAARYLSARELADDLGRFQTGQLVNAREYGALTRFLRFLARRRLPVSVAAVLVVLATTVAIESFRRVVRSRGVAERARDASERDRAAAEARSAELVLAQARAVLERDPTAALAWIKRYPAEASDQAGARMLAADAKSRGVARHVLAGHGDGVNAVAWSADGTRLATADGRAVRVFDANSGRDQRSVPLPGVWRVAWAPDGRRLAAAGSGGEVWLLRADVGEPALLGRTTGSVDHVAVSPDGAQVVAAGAAGALHVWPTDGGPGRDFAAHDPNVGGIGVLAFVDARHVATGGYDGRLRVIDLVGGRIREVPLPGSPFTGLAADGAGRLVFASGDAVAAVAADAALPTVVARVPGGLVRLALVDDGRIAGITGAGTVVAVAPDGTVTELVRQDGPSRALAAGPGGLLAAVDARGDIVVVRGAERLHLHGHVRAVGALAFSSAGVLASGSDDAAVRIWDLPPPVRLQRAAASDVFDVAWTPGGALVAGDRAGGVSLLRGADAPPLVLGRHGQAAYDVEVSADGGFAVSGGWDGVVALWPLAGGRATTLLHGPGRVWGIALFADGRRALSTGDDGRLVRWDLASGQATTLVTLPQATFDIAISHAQGTVAVASDDGAVVLVPAAGGDPVRLDGLSARAARLVFSPDDRTLFAGAHDGIVWSWDVATGRGALLGRHEQKVRTLALSADGRWLASGSADLTVRLIDRASGETQLLRGHDGEVRWLDFDPSGRWLASAGWDGSVRLWSLPAGEPLVLRGHDGRVHRVRFDPSGRLASCGLDGTVRVWTLDGRSAAPGGASEFRSWLAAATSATIDADRALATAVP